VLEGRVVTGGGEPIVGAEVVAFLNLDAPVGDDRRDERMAREIQRLTGRGSASARTGAEGVYKLEHLPEAEFTLVARGPSYEPAELAGVRGGDRVPDLVLRRLASVTGAVTAGVNGDPVREFRLLLVRKTAESEEDVEADFDRMREVKDEEGRFARDRLRPGSYTLGIKARGFAFYRTAFRLEEGEEKALPVALDRGFSVTLQVLAAATGEPIAGARVSCNESHDEPQELDDRRFDFISENRFTDEAGRHTADALAAGKYSLSVRHDDFVAESGSIASVEIPADDGKEFTFRLEAAGRIQGSVANLGEIDLQRANYHLLLRPAAAEGRGTVKEAAPGAEGEGGRDGSSAAEPPAPEQWVWIDGHGGGKFHQGSLRPGTYQVFLKKQVYRTVDGGKPQPIEEAGEPVLLDTVEIEAGKTKSLNLRAP
jgi:hypothetical protein